MPHDSNDRAPGALSHASRRSFVQGLALGSVAAGTGLWRAPAHAQQAAANPVPTLRGNQFDLSIGASRVNFTGRLEQLSESTAMLHPWTGSGRGQNC